MQNSDIQRKQMRNDTSHPSWFNKEYSDAKKAKYQTLRRFRNSNADNDLQEYLEKRNKLKKLVRTKKLDFNENQIDALIHNADDSKTFLGKIKKMTGKNTQRTSCNISKEAWYEHF